MGSLAPLCRAVEVDVQSGSSVAPVALPAIVNTPDRGKCAPFVKHPRLHLSQARALLRKHGGAVIEGAFPERSRRATCHTAARVLGVSPDTVERLIEGDTANPCPLILGYCAAIVRARTGKPTPICKVLGHIIAAEVGA